MSARIPEPEGIRMKIRWTTESVRFRITPTELEMLRRGEPVRACLPLPGGWTAGLYPGERDTHLDASAGELRLLLCQDDVRRLDAPETEGVYFQRPENGLRYYIEKDFPCEHPRPSEALETAETFPRTA